MAALCTKGSAAKNCEINALFVAFQEGTGTNAPYVCESDAILRHFGILSITESNVEKPEHKKMPEKFIFLLTHWENHGIILLT